MGSRTLIDRIRLLDELIRLQSEEAQGSTQPLIEDFSGATLAAMRERLLAELTAVEAQAGPQASSFHYLWETDSLSLHLLFSTLIPFQRLLSVALQDLGTRAQTASSSTDPIRYRESTVIMAYRQAGAIGLRLRLNDPPADASDAAEGTRTVPPVNIGFRKAMETIHELTVSRSPEDIQSIKQRFGMELISRFATWAGSQVESGMNVRIGCSCSAGGSEVRFTIEGLQKALTRIRSIREQVCETMHIVGSLRSLKARERTFSIKAQNGGTIQGRLAEEIEIEPLVGVLGKFEIKKVRNLTYGANDPVSDGVITLVGVEWIAHGG